MTFLLSKYVKAKYFFPPLKADHSLVVKPQMKKSRQVEMNGVFVWDGSYATTRII